MFEKYENWKKKPITRGDYLKLCKWSVAASGLCWLAVYGYYEWQERRVSEKLENWKSKIQQCEQNKETEMFEE